MLMNSQDLPTLNINTSCEFKHLIIDRYQAAPATNMINIIAGNPVFTLCNCGGSKTDESRSYRLMGISGTADVTWNGGSVFGNTNLGGVTYVYKDIVIEDTANLNFICGYFCASVKMYNNSQANINMDVFVVGAHENTRMIFNDNSIAIINIRTAGYYRDINYVKSIFGSTTALAFFVQANDDCQLTLSGVIEGFIELATGSPVINITNRSSIIGVPWHIAAIAVNPAAVVNISDSSILMDSDNDTGGMHIMEDEIGINWNIDNCTIEFTGHSGTWFTMGSPIGLAGHNTNLTILNSHIIDNANDNIPFGANYPGAVISYRNVTIRNSIIEVKNFDGVGANKCLIVGKWAGESIHVILENVTFKNDNASGTGWGVAFPAIGALDVNDYLIESGTINQTQELNVCSDMAVWNYLKGNAP